MTFKQKMMLLVFCLFVTPAWADNLSAYLAAEILKASRHDTSLTDHEKLFEHRCDMIKKYVGYDNTPMSQAIRYSCSDLVIGIVFYAGSDLGKHSPEKVAQHFKDKLAYYGMTSEVFIKHAHNAGSSMAFFVNGEPYKGDPVGPLEAMKLLDALSADARLTYFDNGQITPQQLKEWIQSAPANKDKANKKS